MKNKKLFIVLAFLLMTTISITIYADDLRENIEVIFNSINIVVNGEKVTANNIPYKDTTYVPLRAIAEMLNKNVAWDQKTKTAMIDEPENDKLKIIYASPKESSEDAFLQWGYINLVFEEDMEKLGSTKNIYLIDCYGERIQIESVVPGITAKNNLLIIPKINRS